MKKCLIIFMVVVLLLSLASCYYKNSEEPYEPRGNYDEYKKGYEQGYNEAKYELKGEIEEIRYEAYQQGYHDALKDMGIYP